MSDRGISENTFSNWSEKPHSSTLSLIDLNFKLNVFNPKVQPEMETGERKNSGK